MLREKMLNGKTIDKAEQAVGFLRIYAPSEGYWLAFSGGKDSITIKRLAEMAGVKFEAHYSVTTIDPPELVKFICKHHPDVIWNRPAKPFLVRLVEKGFPLRQRRWCCAEYKEAGGSGRVVVTGVRAEESFKRAGRKVFEQCYRDGTRSYVNPILNWTDGEVWEFIRQEGIPYCSLYGEGMRRLGCIMCPASDNQRAEASRWPGYAKQFRRAFVQLYDRKKNNGDVSIRRWANGNEMFDWWLNPRKTRHCPDQGVLFE